MPLSQTAEQSIKILNMVRGAVQQGLLQDDLPRLENYIFQETKRIEKINRRQFSRRMPYDLQQAYTALKALTPQHLQRFINARAGKKHRARIPGLLAVCEQVHLLIIDELNQTLIAVDDQAGKPSPGFAYDYLQRQTALICRALDGKHAGEFDFSKQAFRAVQWLMMLAEHEVFCRHLNVVGTAMDLLNQELKASPRLRRFIGSPVQVRLFPGSALYRTRVKDGQIILTINEGYLDASDAVLEALVRCAVSTGSPVDKHLMTSYSSSKSYLQVSQKLLHQEKPGYPEQGLFHNLMHIYERLVADYFPGKDSLPQLRWMERTSYRTYGVYQASSDTIRISPALDHPEVPESVIAYVLFHELVHSRVGTQVKNGRNKIHSKRFYAVERKFSGWEDAAAFLHGMSRDRYRS